MNILVSFQIETPLGVFQGRGRIADRDEYDYEAAKPRDAQCTAVRIDDVVWDSTGPVIDHARGAWWWREDYTYAYPYDIIQAAEVPTKEQAALFAGVPRVVSDTTPQRHDPDPCTPNEIMKAFAFGLVRGTAMLRGDQPTTETPS